MGFGDDEVRQVVAAVEAVRSPAAADEVWVTGFSAGGEPTDNQLVVFLKPEVTEAGVQLDQVLAVLRDRLEKHAVEVGAVRVVNGAFLERAQLMRDHYGVINAVSRLGAEALSEAARTTLRERFGQTTAQLLGGHQFLREYPQFSPYALHVLFANCGNVKLAPGTYVCQVSLEGREVLLLNGFHPYQLERFTQPAAVTVLLEGRSGTPWRVLRHELAGATDPRAAAADSFRQVLLERAGQLGVPQVSQNYNGLHLSAGPLEGMVELRRFFAADTEVPLPDTCFGRLLADTGLASETIAKLAGNPLLAVDGRQVSAFDLTEELDAEPAAQALHAAIG